MSEGLIIIPAYNEQSKIGDVIEDIKSLNLNLDILVVDDGSKDKTKDIVMEKNINIISHPFNLGYGTALQTGFKYAVKKKYKYVIQFDGDGQHIANYICDMKKEFKKEDYDIVIGSRFINKEKYKIGFFKIIVIKLMRTLIKFLTGQRVTDPTSGFKGLSYRTFKYYSLMTNFPSDYPDADIIIRMIRHNYKLKEIPITIKKRTSGKSMHSGLKPIVYLLKILLSIFIIILRDIFLREKDI